jgi:peptidoglycan/LPS O-acetylase OafA/YrhL
MGHIAQTGRSSTVARVRDPAVDFVKAGSLLIVVGMHSLMAGVTSGPEGLTVVNALTGQVAFSWATWGLQVMPLFFLLGGFASLTSWRRLQADGGSAGDYIRQRVNRLARPAVLPVAVVGATLAALALLQLPPTVLDEVGHKIAQPLWFLAVYLGCSAFVPLTAWLHENAKIVTLASLLSASLVVDTISVTFHIAAVSYLNFLFVWLFIQQLGFWLADGWFTARPRWLLLLLAVASYGTLAVLTLVVGYSIDMYDNLNPATTCIVVLSIGQVFLMSFVQPWIARFAERPRVSSAVAAINRNSMTIYLWHVPVVVLIALTMLLTSLPMAPLTSGWWQTRPLFLALVAIALIPVVVLVQWWERSHPRFVPVHTPVALGIVKVVLGIAGVATILLLGFTPTLPWAIGLGLIVAAVWIGPPPVVLPRFRPPGTARAE